MNPEPTSGPGTRGDDAVRVLFIAGAGRCGSTLVDRLLDQYDGVFAAGEIYRVFTDSLSPERRPGSALGGCGCGKPFRECEVWAAIFEEAYGGIDKIPIARLADLSGRVRTRYSGPANLSRYPRRLWLKWLEEYPGQLERLFCAIRTVTGCRVVVDASKDPFYGQVLLSRPALSVKTLHLVRDSRAHSHAWSAPKTDDRGEVVMPTHGLLNAAFVWAVFNEFSSRLGRGRPEDYLLMHYERFATDPAPSLAAIGDLLGEVFDSTPLVDPHTGRLETSHSVYGNSNRFEGGSAPIRLDARWIDEQPRRERPLITALTAWGLYRYGYPIRRVDGHSLSAGGPLPARLARRR